MTNTILFQNIAKHLAGSSAPNLEILYIGLSTTFEEPNINSILEGEYYRVAPDSVTINATDNSIIDISLDIGAGTATLASSAISSVTSSSEVTVASAAAFTVGDRVLFRKNSTTNPYTQQLKITNISTNTLTFENAINITPLATDTIEQLISRIHLVSNSSTASATLNSGDPVAIFQYIREKGASDNLEINLEVKLK